MSLKMKYFVLKPASKNITIDPYARASREAMKAYADSIYFYDEDLAHALHTWVKEEEQKDLGKTKVCTVKEC